MLIIFKNKIPRTSIFYVRIGFQRAWSWNYSTAKLSKLYLHKLKNPNVKEIKLTVTYRWKIIFFFTGRTKIYFHLLVYYHHCIFSFLSKLVKLLNSVNKFDKYSEASSNWHTSESWDGPFPNVLIYRTLLPLLMGTQIACFRNSSKKTTIEYNTIPILKMKLTALLVNAIIKLSEWKASNSIENRVDWKVL